MKFFSVRPIFSLTEKLYFNKRGEKRRETFKKVQYYKKKSYNILNKNFELK